MQRSRPASRLALEGHLRAWVRCSAVLAVCLATAVLHGQEATSSAEPDVAGVRDGPGAPAKLLLLVRSRDDTGVMAHLRSELERTAYDLVEIRLDDRHADIPLGRVAREQRATAAVRFDAPRGEIELWISKPEGSVVDRISGEGARLSDWVLVLRTTEALRAHGLDLGPAPASSPTRQPEPQARASPPEPGPSPAVVTEDGLDEEPRAPSRTRLGLGLGLGTDLSSQAMPVQYHLHGNLHARWFGIVHARAFGWLPLHRAELVGQEGKARVKTWLLGSSVDVLLLRRSPTSLAVGAGYAFGVHTMSGAASRGYRSAADRVATHVPFARADGRLGLTDFLELDLAALVGFSLPEVTVEFGERARARWGRPFFALELTLQAPIADF